MIQNLGTMLDIAREPEISIKSLSQDRIDSLALEMEWDEYDKKVLWGVLQGNSYNKIRKDLKSNIAKVIERTKGMAAQLGIANLSRDRAARQEQFLTVLSGYVSSPVPAAALTEDSLAPVFESLGLDADTRYFLIALCGQECGNQKEFAQKLGWSKRKTERQIYTVLPLLGLAQPTKCDHMPMGQLRAVVRGHLWRMTVDSAHLTAAAGTLKKTKVGAPSAKDIGIMPDDLEAILVLARAHHIPDDTVKAWCLWMSGESISRFLRVFPGDSIEAVEKRFLTMRGKLCASVTSRRTDDWLGFIDWIKKQRNAGYFDAAIEAFSIPFFVKKELGHVEQRVCVASWQGRNADAVAAHLKMNICNVRCAQVRAAVACGVRTQKIYNLADVRHVVATNYVDWRRRNLPYNIVDFTVDFAGLYGCKNAGLAVLALMMPHLRASPGATMRGLSIHAAPLYLKLFPGNKLSGFRGANEVERTNGVERLWENIRAGYSALSPTNQNINATSVAAMLNQAVAAMQR